MRIIIRRVLAILGLAAISVSFAPAAEAVVPAVRLSYAALNTRSLEGQKAVVSRIDRVADLVCSQDDPRFRATRAEEDACRGRTIDHVTAGLRQRGITLP